jgi:hypothetical protein
MRFVRPGAPPGPDAPTPMSLHKPLQTSLRTRLHTSPRRYSGWGPTQNLRLGNYGWEMKPLALMP